MSEMVERVARAIAKFTGPDPGCIVARAAIAAMREPTAAMLAAYFTCCHSGGDIDYDHTVTDAYHAMIDEALK